MPQIDTKAKLIALVGAGAAAWLLTALPVEEGVLLRGYADPLGVPTKCMGDTKNVVIGKRYSAAECQQSLMEAIIRHAEPVITAAPELHQAPDSVVFAVVSFAYNTGVGSDGTRQLIADAHRQDWRGLCRDILTDPRTGRRWYITGRNAQGARVLLPGLVKRRDVEYGACVTDLRLPKAETRAIGDAARVDLDRIKAGRQAALDELTGE